MYVFKLVLTKFSYKFSNIINVTWAQVRTIALVKKEMYCSALALLRISTLT